LVRKRELVELVFAVIPIRSGVAAEAAAFGPPLAALVRLRPQSGPRLAIGMGQLGGLHLPASGRQPGD
jgi:hypothetical protein